MFLHRSPTASCNGTRTSLSIREFIGLNICENRASTLSFGCPLTVYSAYRKPVFSMIPDHVKPRGHPLHCQFYFATPVFKLGRYDSTTTSPPLPRHPSKGTAHGSGFPTDRRKKNCVVQRPPSKPTFRAEEDIIRGLMR